MNQDRPFTITQYYGHVESLLWLSEDIIAIRVQTVL